MPPTKKNNTKEKEKSMSQLTDDEVKKVNQFTWRRGLNTGLGITGTIVGGYAAYKLATLTKDYAKKFKGGAFKKFGK